MLEPNGGTKDTTAPEVIPQKSFPQNKSINFNAEKIVLNFNEYVQLKSQLVVITPALTIKPTIKAKGKKIEISFNEPPKPNTTYTINFAGAITDITENNTVQNLQYVFSTGPFLDSLSISGKVVSAFSQSGIGSSTVILHSGDDDSAIFNRKPSYYLKTDKDGNFSFRNLKQGKYKMYSLNDKNADLMYNGYPEEIAFLDSVILLDINIVNVKLMQFKPANKKLIQTSTASISKWMQVYKYNKLIPNVNVEPIKPIFNNAIGLYTKYSLDSIFYLVLKDTSITDTIYLKLTSNDLVIDTIKFTSHRSKKMKSNTTYRLNSPPEFYVTDSIFIATNMQCSFNKDLISITDTLHKKNIPFAISTSIFGIKIIPDKQIEKIPLKIICLPGSITSTITKKSCDSLIAISTYYPIEKMGSIQLTIKELDASNFNNPICVLLMDGKYLATLPIVTGAPVVGFELLKPANYSFYIFSDDDGNGIWSPGDFNTKTQAEKIKWYTQPVKVKANWTQDLTWIF